MTERDGARRRWALGFAVACTVLLVFSLAGLWIWRDQVFLERGTVTWGGETVILVAFLLIPVFNLASVGWTIDRLRRSPVPRASDAGVLVLGLLCLLLMVGAKVMVDEIGRESLLGWDVAGEWAILYVILAIQLVYDGVIVRRLQRA